MKVVIVVLGVAALLLAAMLWNGFILSCLWEWFIVPLGVRPLAIGHAIGVSCVVGLFTLNLAKDESDKTSGPLDKTIVAFSSSFFVLLLGWVIHTWFM
jgi:hypothetical protein